MQSHPKVVKVDFCLCYADFPRYSLLRRSCEIIVCEGWSAAAWVMGAWVMGQWVRDYEMSAKVDV